MGGKLASDSCHSRQEPPVQLTTQPWHMLCGKSLQSGHSEEAWSWRLWKSHEREAGDFRGRLESGEKSPFQPSEDCTKSQEGVERVCRRGREGILVRRGRWGQRSRNQSQRALAFTLQFVFYTYSDEVIENKLSRTSGVVAHIWNLKTWEAETWQSRVQGQPELPRKILYQKNKKWRSRDRVQW